MDHDDYLYDAFISYRRSDGTNIATWLRRRLQDYRLPPSLSAQRKKLRVYLDTAFERANEDFWTHNIEPALKSSCNLIVIASPDTLPSPSDHGAAELGRARDRHVSQPSSKHEYSRGSREGRIQCRPSGSQEIRRANRGTRYPG